MAEKHSNDPTEARPVPFRDFPLPSLERRHFLKVGMGSLAALATTGVMLEPLRDLEDAPTAHEFLQKHYTELTPDLMEPLLRRIETHIAEDYGVRVQVGDDKPLPGVEFGYALNLSRCNGSRRCVTACMRENNMPEDHPEMAYIRVFEMDIDTMDLEMADHLYDREEVPQKGKFYMPVSCQQCRNSPCSKVCPVKATWGEPDGIRTIDYNWCIGCRYCMASCPYGARRFNWSKPQISPEKINPDMGYMSNRIRPRGVVEKCHFCMHRTRRGKNPACMEVCPTGARVFGNLLDPDGKIQTILKTKRVYVLKGEAKTLPRFYYFFDK
jgi:molybdopterin-containing oxidoreductase family iron-sulfur binding subunit